MSDNVNNNPTWREAFLNGNENLLPSSYDQHTDNDPSSIHIWIGVNVHPPPYAEEFDTDILQDRVRAVTAALGADEVDKTMPLLLTIATSARLHDNETAVETTFSQHYLSTILHLFEKFQNDGLGLYELKFLQQHTLNLGWVEKSGIERTQGFRPDAVFARCKPHTEPSIKRRTARAICVLEAKALKKVTSCVRNLKKCIGAAGETAWGAFTLLLIKQAAAYAAAFRTQFAVVYDMESMVFFHFKELPTGADEDFVSRLECLGEYMSVQVVQGEENFLPAFCNFLLMAERQTPQDNDFA